MSIRAYFPSTQFGVIVFSLLISGGLVFAAQYVTKQPQGHLTSTDAPQPTEDWQATLDQIQAQSGATLPDTPAPQTVQSILASASTPNLTETVARSLFITLTNAKAQGLGDDAPTQDQLVAQALAQSQSAAVTDYGTGDIKTVAPTQASLRAYGNAVMRIFTAHPGADAEAALLAVGYAVDYHDATKLGPLAAIGAEYRALVHELAALPVPQTLVPLHVQILNNLLGMAKATEDMRALVTDPVRGLSGVQSFSSLGNETNRVFTTIADTLAKNGILFSKEEPGSTWAAFSSSVQTQQQ